MCDLGFAVLPMDAIELAVAAGSPPWLGMVEAPGMVAAPGSVTGLLVGIAIV
jgi:hypothetical protein